MGFSKNVSLQHEVTKSVYFIGNECMLIDYDSNRLDLVSYLLHYLSAHCATFKELLCRSAALLPLSPLRTVRATFTAYSSDNSKFNSHKIKSAHNHLAMTCFR